jgi:peptidoglycan/LPS O-acetylase OafA/YrhL
MLAGRDTIVGTDAAAGRHLPHVDGLRALAVLAVLAFHAAVPGVGGGYAGVDIFFVISGFVITRLIARQQAEGTFRLAHFWARRVRRLLPAYAPVLAFVLVATWLVYMPADLARAGRALAAVSVFASNILFWQESGYFSAQAEVKPLLHTWSLAVEEQFYLLYPLLLPLLLRGGARRTAWVLVGAGVLSLAAATVMLRVDAAAAFYLLPTRAWELLMGAALVFAPLPAARWRSIAAAAGVAAMLAAVFLYDAATPFPGVAALLPCGGAALAIWAGQGGEPVTRALFGNAPAQFFGRISYGLYLWHWPLLAVWRYAHFGALDWRAGVPLLALAVLLAWISYHVVEQPFREGRLRRVPAWAIVLAVSGTGVVAGALLIRGGGYPQRLPAAARAILAVQTLDRQPGCMSGRPAYRAPAVSCRYGARVPADTVVWGDSHAHALVDTLGREMGTRGRAVRFLGTFACPPVAGVARANVIDTCAAYNAQALAWLVRTRAIRHVVLMARHPAYLLGPTTAWGPSEGSDETAIRLLPVAGAPDAPLAAGYLARLERTVAALRAAGKQVTLVLPVPEVAYSVPEVLALKSLRGEPVAFDRPRAMYDARAGAIRAALRAIAGRRGAATVDPAAFLCDARACRTAEGGRPLYYDDDHLAPLGAGKLAALLLAGPLR